MSIEGHSAVSTDLMYRFQNDQEHVDADAQSELGAVYGAMGGGSGGGGCNADPAGCDIRGLKAQMLQLAQTLPKTVTMQEGVPTGA